MLPRADTAGVAAAGHYVDVDPAPPGVFDHGGTPHTPATHTSPTALAPALTAGVRVGMGADGLGSYSGGGDGSPGHPTNTHPQLPFTQQQHHQHRAAGQHGFTASPSPEPLSPLATASGSGAGGGAPVRTTSLTCVTGADVSYADVATFPWYDFSCRSIPPRWGSIRSRLAPRTYARRGVRVVSLTKSRIAPNLENISALYRGQVPPRHAEARGRAVSQGRGLSCRDTRAPGLAILVCQAAAWVRGRGQGRGGNEQRRPNANICALLLWGD